MIRLLTRVGIYGLRSRMLFFGPLDLHLLARVVFIIRSIQAENICGSKNVSAILKK